MSPLLLACFAVSGFVDAMFGIALVRQFSFSFGSGFLALSLGYGAAIAAFAAGISWAGPFSLRLKQPRQAFAFIHSVTGVLIAASVAAMAVFSWFAPLAVIPIFLIGSEAPLLFAALAARRLPSDRLSRITGGAYACKFAGAALGALLCGFVLMPYLGFWATIGLIAVMHLAIAAAAAKSANIFPAPQLGPAVPAGHVNRIILAVIGLAGFCVTASAAVWTRSLAAAAGTSLWSYVSIASVFCFGLAAGFAISAWQAPKARYPEWSLALVGLLTGAFSIGGLFALPLLPRWHVLTFRASDDSAVLFQAGSMALLGIVLIPVAILLGATFPLALQCIQGESRASEVVGRYGSAAAAAAWIGAILAGSILVPAVGLKGALLLPVAAACAIAMLGCAWLTAWPPVQRIAVAAAPVVLTLGAIYAAPDWDPYPFAAGAYAGARSISTNGPDTHFEVLHRTRLEMYEEGSTSTVAVNAVGPRRLLWIDGRLEEDPGATQPLPIDVPLSSGRQIRDVFIAGMGTGVVPQILAQRVTGRIEVAEREIGVIDAAKKMTSELLSNDRVHVRHEDPRIALREDAPGSYDLIVAADIASWTSASARLSTSEFYSIGRSRLRPAGIFAQRIGVVRLDLGAIQSLLKSFTSAFPEVLVLSSGRNAPELILIGSDQPVRLDWGAMKKSAAPDRPDPGVMISRILFGTAEARAFAGGAPENTDHNGIVEFSSLANLSKDMSAANGKGLYAQAADPWKYVSGAPELSGRKEALVEMALSALVTNDTQRALKYASDLRTAGDDYDSDRLTGNVLYILDRREEAVALWRRCEERNREDARVLKSLVDYYRLLQPSQRPARYDEWTQIVAKSSQ